MRGTVSQIQPQAGWLLWRRLHWSAHLPERSFRFRVLEDGLGGNFENENGDPKHYAVQPTFVIPYQALLNH